LDAGTTLIREGFSKRKRVDPQTDGRGIGIKDPTCMLLPVLQRQTSTNLQSSLRQSTKPNRLKGSQLLVIFIASDPVAPDPMHAWSLLDKSKSIWTQEL